MVSQAIGPVGFGKAESDRVDLVIELVQGAAAPFRLCTREGLAFAAARGLHIDWASFADDWRGGYSPSMNRVHRIELPWTNIDVLHRMVLDELLVKYSITSLSEADKDYLNRIWHRFTAWPDAIPGLTRLRTRYVLATLSNGHVALLTNMAKYAGLPWDCMLSAELMQHYKPDPETYLTAAALLHLRPEQVMMVAAHKGNLRTAQVVGLQTAFVPRLMEWGPERTPDLRPDQAFTVHTVDFNDLAAKLGV